MELPPISIFVRFIWGVPKIRGALLGVPIVRIIVFGGSILGYPYFGKIPYRVIVYGLEFKRIFG